MSHITRDEVQRVAALARLSLAEDALERMASELDAILGYVETLQRVDTREVPPMAHVLPLETPVREDQAAPPMDPSEAVSNAPASDGTAFAVPKVIEGEEEG